MLKKVYIIVNGWIWISYDRVLKAVFALTFLEVNNGGVHPLQFIMLLYEMRCLQESWGRC